jgi:NAD(P)-dependent dehydrogenase (short-subunit alcohol dehydrogenase family)
VSRVRAKVIDAPADEPIATLVASLLAELAAAEPEVEVCWSRGARRVVRPIAAALAGAPAPSVPRGGAWVITGGARGITAIAARGLARRYGWKLHLVGKSPAPQANAAWRHYDEAQMKTLKTTLARQAVAEGRSPSEAWDRVMKDVEIFNNLAAFASAGVSATYHACDITDRAALSAVLDEVRRKDGPIRGIMHGAGVIDPSRFEGKRRAIVTALVGTKFDGTLNLMALTARDPLAYFIGFGSISGRFGGNGLTDYSAGNDALAKVIDWYRAARRDCASACIHWESWEGSGMATLPRFAWGPKSVMNMKYMLPEEGVRRLEQELEAGLPDSEVLYTFGDFYPMFYPHEQRPLGEFHPDQFQCPNKSPVDREPPLARNVRREGAEMVVDIPLDPAADAFLIQHRLRDKPLLPVVVGLEALAEASALASGAQVLAFRDVQMLDGLLFHTDRPVTASARAVAGANGTFDCRLTCDFRNRGGGLIQKDRPYLRATAETGDTRSNEIVGLEDPPSGFTDFTYPDDSAVYHGPALRGATGIACNRAGGWGRIASLPLADLVGASRADRWTIPSCVLDNALYACGIHLWMHGEGAISLPKSIGRLRFGRAPRAGESCLVRFVCRDIAVDAARYDFTVVGDDGALIVAAEDYRKVILTRGGAK